MNRIKSFIGDAPNKHFSNAVITWKIQRFTFMSCFEKRIHSPEINLIGPVETTWKMDLCILPKKNRVSLALGLLSNIDPLSCVKVRWASFILNEKEEGSILTERLYSFVPKYRLTVEMYSISDILEVLNTKPSDNLVIKCCILVDLGLNGKFPISQVESVAALSNDLFSLPTDFLYHDILTTVDNVEFSLHKAMLYQRGEILANLIEQATPDMKVNLPLSNYKAAEALFSYFYSGNLSYILNRPNLTIFDYINRLGVHELKHVYPQQEIKIISKPNVKEHKFGWMILDFKNVSETVLSPTFHEDGMEARFQLCLNIKKSKDNNSKKSLFIDAILVESEKKIAVWLEFECGKDENNIKNSQRIHGSISGGDRLGVMLLDSDFPEMEECFLSETLVVKFRVCIRVGNVLGNIEENESLSKDITNERYVMNLSKVLGNLLKSHDYSDFRFKVEDKEFRAHRFLVAARSSVFSELLSRHKLGFAEVSHYTKDIFEAFLSFLYIGIITETDALKLMKLWWLGKIYNVSSLMNICINLIQNLINDDNMLEILAFADDIDDFSLVKVSFNYVLERANTLDDHPDLFNFQSRKRRMYARIKAYVPKE